MADYVYLAGLAYRSDDIAQDELDSWFGPGVATNNPAVVENFRTDNNYTSPVSYKLITFGGTNALIAIRGTTNPWDALADAQLWSAAACFQVQYRVGNRPYHSAEMHANFVVSRS
jgi:hypothetical protein